MRPTHVHLDPLLDAAAADAMIEVCSHFGTYSTYGSDAAPEESGQTRFAPEIPQRYDAALNFIRTGGRFAQREDARMLAARTNYFRATYYYEGRDAMTPGIEPLLHHEGFLDAARKIHGKPLVVPGIVYANLLLPGQELAVHTDVPEFRGMSRMSDPQWLLVAMHHSGLFARWRMPIVTAVAYFQSCEGGEFAFYPEGPHRPARALPVRHNTAVILDTDSVFHGVDRVAENGRSIPALRPGMQLWFAGEETWEVGTPSQVVGTYRWGEVRFSVSWKAYCYADEAERRMTVEHTDDLTRERALDALVDDLRARGRIGDETPEPRSLALTIIDEYIRFPDPAAALAS